MQNNFEDSPFKKPKLSEEEEEEEQNYEMEDNYSIGSLQDRLEDVSFEVVGKNESFVKSKEKKSWLRPIAPIINPNETGLVFQQLEIDESASVFDSKLPMVRMYGVTKDGYSVMCRVHHFFPYFYFPAPIGLNENDLNSLKNALVIDGRSDIVKSIELVKKQSIYGYSSNDLKPFIKVNVYQPKAISGLRRLLKEGISFGRFQDYQPDTYESNIEYLLRFMIDTKVVGGNWIELKPGQYQLANKKISRCQIEVDVNFDNFISYAPEKEWSSLAPLRVLSFDIECSGRKGIFPDPTFDPVIQIANVIQLQGQFQPIIKTIFCLKETAPIAGAQILCFDTEEELLMAWSEFIQLTDPDLTIGYNINNFDFPYLLDRASHLKLDKFPYLGRINSIRTICKDAHFSSKAYGARDLKVVNTEGRLQLDILQVMLRDYKLRSYSLNAVCDKFLKETKEDVHYSIISDLQNGDSETRRRLAIYCLKDALLPLRLMDKLMVFYNYIEMARVTGIPFSYLLSRGQQIKVISQLYRKAQLHHFVIPHKDASGSIEAYEGATVIEPERGYYKEPIATLDFASLYPSIMMAHNLCYTTLSTQSECSRLNLVKDQDFTLTPNNDIFVKPNIRKGLLPMILEELITARKQAKKDLKKETDPFKKAVLDGRQLALKISANSVYGFTGATVGKLPCLQISSSVTSFGRLMIEQTKTIVEDKFEGAKVIYGDTDSVMVKFKVDTIEQAMELGTKAAELVTKNFIQPISLEFEKVYCPYLLISKKRYAGLYWSNPIKYDKLDTKGIETVRRDSCQLVSTVIGECLNKALIEADLDGAINYAKNVISDLLRNKIDMSQLVITKNLAKTDYANRQPHSELADKMRKRDAGSAPNLGDRVAFVIIDLGKNLKVYERSEDPIYVLQNQLPIDTQFYLDNQLSKPLMRMFEPILGETKARTILSGEHTRTVSRKNLGSVTKGGLMGFAVKVETCLGCKKPLNKEEKGRPVCKNCKTKVPMLFNKEITIHQANEVRYNRLWSECQRCQGSTMMEVLCSSNDCPIFYMRTKAQLDLTHSTQSVNRFSTDW